MSLLRDKFISFLQLKGFTKATVRNYIQSIKQFQDWLGKSPVHVTRDLAHRYLDYLKNGKRLAPRTMNIHIYALKRFCDFFLPESDVMSPFSRMRTPKYQPPVISASETQALINAAPNLKAKAIITTIYSAGLRISECLGSLANVADEQSFKDLVTTLYAKEWTVYIKQPFASPEALVEYLGAYTHRVAISDSRIVEHNRQSVSFAYKDYAHEGVRKIMTLTATEFVRRFLLHVLPQGFKKIRYFGFLAPRAKAIRFTRCRMFFNKKAFEPKKGSSPWYRIVKELTGRDPRR